MNASLSAYANFMLPSQWKASASAQLSPQENVLAWLEVDLDAQLQFAKGLLIVTDQRILSGQFWLLWTRMAELGSAIWLGHGPF
jgi:ATP-binding cassette subfamily B protein